VLCVPELNKKLLNTLLVIVWMFLLHLNCFTVCQRSCWLRTCWWNSIPAFFLHFRCFTITDVSIHIGYWHHSFTEEHGKHDWKVW